MKQWFAVAAIALAGASVTSAQQLAPHAIDIPPWFTESFLDFREDIRDAARDGRRLLIYFGQDGCPYCQQLMLTNFSQRAIVDKTRRHFVAVALNLWGDREVTWLDGQTMREKDLGRTLQVQFTPTLLFFDEKGEVVVRLNGYYPPNRFAAVLDYVAAKKEHQEPLADFLARTAKDAASARLHAQPFFLKAPYDLRRTPGGKPLLALFESAYCATCDEMHREGFARSDVAALLARFDVVQFALGSPTPLTTPDGRTTTAGALARELRVAYTPTLVFFDTRGIEVFRIDAYLRPFHLASSLDYVASGAYITEPSFQRFIQARAERLRARGERIDLWK